MSWIIWMVIGFIVLGIIGLLAGILYTQKQLDIPYSGILLVDHQEEEKTLVYFQAAVDPKTYKDGETVKLRVKIVK